MPDGRDQGVGNRGLCHTVTLRVCPGRSSGPSVIQLTSAPTSGVSGLGEALGEAPGGRAGLLCGRQGRCWAWLCVEPVLQGFDPPLSLLVK